MERSRFRFTTLAALCCLMLGVVLGALALSGVAGAVPSATYLLKTGAIVSVLGSAGLLILTGLQLWAAVRGERVAYRVLYHAEQPLEGKAIGPILEAVARNTGPVTLVWCLLRGAAPDASVHSDPSGARTPEPRPEPGQPARDPKLDEPGTPSADRIADTAHTACSPVDISLYIVASASARSTLDDVFPSLLPDVWAEKCNEPEPPELIGPGWAVRVWRWDTAQAGSGNLADPLACGAHLSDLEQGIFASVGACATVREIEVRLTLWPQGCSALVTARYGPPEVRPEPAAVLPAQLTDVPCALPHVVELPFLKSLLWSWPFQRKTNLEDPPATREGFSGGNRSGARPHLKKSVRANTEGGPWGWLISLLASRYPLWERPGAAPSHKSSLMSAQEYSQAGDAVIPEGGPSDRKGDRGSACLHFPPTTAPYSSLDSINAGEVSLPHAYSLPPLPSQVLILGSATKDGRPVGVPALRRLAGALPPILGPAGSGSTATSARQEHTRPSLHPMLAEHLLITGGTDAWRRDIAGSVVSQSLEMGMTVVTVDGGEPSDEPPPPAHKRARLISADAGRTISASSSAHPDRDRHGGHDDRAPAGSADPLSSTGLRLEGSAIGKWVAQIDLDNPAGSVRPNMLYVPAPHSLPPVQGESLAVSLALGVGLAAQMRFLQAMNVTGMAAGIIDAGIDAGPPAGKVETGWRAYGFGSAPGEAIVEAWLTVLLLRHHRVRLLLAASDVAVPGVEHARIERPYGNAALISSVARPPSCPDLPTLMLILEEPETLLNLLRRERSAWSDPDWVNVMHDMGGVEGERAVRSAQGALERAASIESLDLSDQYLYGATLRGQLRRLLSHPAMARMLRGPHISLAELLDDGTTRMLKVNLSGAYRTAALPYTDDDLARKQYGLYLLWSLWAASRQRAALSEQLSAHPPHEEATQTKPNPLLLMLHGAGSWFGSNSPLSDPSVLAELGSEGSGIALAATVSGLRHVRAYMGGACETFGNLVIGRAPGVDLDASRAILNVVDAEMRFLREGMHRLSARGAEQTTTRPLAAANSPVDRGRQALDGERLLRVLHRIDESTALVVTRMPGGGKAICTARVGSQEADDVRDLWLSSAIRSS